MWDGQMPRSNWMEGYCPTPGMESAGKCPTIARGGGGGHCWIFHLKSIFQAGIILGGPESVVGNFAFHNHRAL